MKQSNPNEGRAVRRFILSVPALAISAIAASEPLGHLFAPGGHRRRWSGTIASFCNPRKLSMPITETRLVLSRRHAG
jgi:hypothetical protein